MSLLEDYTLRMMFTRVKKIPAFFLLLAGAVFYAHMLIPHDHHLADFDVCQENAGQVPGKHTTSHNGFPVHCHAFNDLTSEKAIIYVVFRHIEPVSPDPGSRYDLNEFASPTTWTKVYSDFNFTVNSGNLNLLSLRAPPLAS